MKRLTDKRLATPPGQWQEVTDEQRMELQEIQVPSKQDLYYRLCQIEDILGDDYDLDRLREIMEADKDGRCVVLPVKPGTPVYSTIFCKLDKDGIEHPTCVWPFETSMMNGWGTEWFKTKEEAEAALAKLNSET